MLGLPQWLRSKQSTCNAEAVRNVGSIPGSGRSPGGGNSNPLQYSCLENLVDRGVFGLWCIGSEYDMTEATLHACMHDHSDAENLINGSSDRGIKQSL